MPTNKNKLAVMIELDKNDEVLFWELKQYMGVKHNAEVVRSALKHTHRSLMR